MEHKFNIMVNRLAEIEQAFSDYKQKSEERFYNQMQKQEQLEQKIVELTDKYNTAVEKFNTANHGAVVKYDTYGVRHCSCNLRNDKSLS